MAFPEFGRRGVVAVSAATAAVITIVVVASGGDDGAATDRADEPEASQPADEAGSPSTIAPVVVAGDLQVDEDGFEADVLLAEVGVPFVITNNDDEPHAWSSDDGFVSSGLVEPGESFRHVYAEPGTRRYHCEVHPDEILTVDVVAAS